MSYSIDLSKNNVIEAGSYYVKIDPYVIWKPSWHFKTLLRPFRRTHKRNESHDEDLHVFLIESYRNLESPKESSRKYVVWLGCLNK